MTEVMHYGLLISEYYTLKNILMRLQLFFCCLVLSMALSTKADPPSEEGQVIFTNRCASCHNANVKIVGPALAGIHERRSMEWIVSFVQSSQTLIKNGDKQAVELFASFNNIPMPDHKDLSAEQIRNVIEYIKSQAKTVAAAAPLARVEKIRPAYLPIRATDYWAFAAILGSVMLLVIALLLYAWVKQHRYRLAARP